MFDLHGKVAVVTGASVGLGRGFAFAMARQGADVAILARRKEKLDQVAEEVRSLGVKCLPVKCDVNDLEEVKAASSTLPRFSASSVKTAFRSPAISPPRAVS